MAKSCFIIDVGAVEDFVKATEKDPNHGRFTFRTVTRWEGGAAAVTEARGFTIGRTDEPPALGGGDSGPNPVEHLLTALATCYAAGLATRAARQGIDFRHLEIITEGDLDLRGYLGLDPDVRPGYTGVRYTVRIDTDAPREVVEQLLETTHRYSPMVETIANGVPIERRVEYVGGAAQG